MSYLTRADNKEVSDILAEAKAIKFAVLQGAISYEEAKNRANNLLILVNDVGEKIAQKYGRRYKKIKFSDL